jgi:hypothetical protein
MASRGRFNIRRRSLLEGAQVPASVTPLREVKIEFGGRLIGGSYAVLGGVVTVYSAFGIKSTQLGNSPAERIAQMLLRELVTASKRS